ncbi:MAG: hypothetical protein FJW39_01560 [Acidobacteria bacterium]|nr:hypothetical protein [Acidobacteriota bacterium]
MRWILAAVALPVLAMTEIRGVWVDRSSLVSRDEIRTTLRNLADAHFNTVHVNVWSRGYPLWHSRVFERETGILTDPGMSGRDVLAEVIEEARPLGLAVIPWFEYGFVGGWDGYFPGPGRRGVIFETHPDWLAMTRAGVSAFPIQGGGGNFFWMVHTRPDVQDFLIALVAEVAGNYAVPAVEFDRARYPQMDCGYDAYTRQAYADAHNGNPPPDDPNNPKWVEWRTGNLNAFMRRLYQGVKDADWRVLITNAPVPLPTSVPNFAQNYGDWVREGSLDFVSPQVYRRDVASFERDLQNQIRALPSARRLVPGLDITNSGPDELVKMISAVRAQGLPGVVVWYYRSLLTMGALPHLRATIFEERAALPWRRARVE